MKFPKIIFILTLLYFCTSLGHFAHNAEFICEYPNLPAWITRAKVYGAWAVITSVGLLGCLFVPTRFAAAGMLLIAAYAALGFDGLAHYAIAPIELHTFTANLTILSEVGAAALLMPVALFTSARHLLSHGVGRRRFADT